ncbi:MAG: TonB-dependent receptor [Terrimonas sp.]|nr:TonB-dependent receptor [Terrimonas sp.]
MTKLLFFLSAFIFSLQTLYAQSSGSIKGTVTTSDNKPAAAVTVHIKGTNKSTLTDDKGNFRFKNIAPSTYILEVSLVGYADVDQRVTVSSNEEARVGIQLQVTANTLQEVVISGGTNKFAKKESEFVARLPLTNLENPQSYSVVTKEIMQEQLVTTIEGALKNAAGISNAAPGPGGGGTSVGFASRGFRTGSTNTRNGLTAGNVTLLDPVNMERIEAIKGPSATLFGSQAVSYGGLVNIVTKQPFETFKGEVGYTAGSFGFNRVTADINTPLNEEKTALFRINAAGETQNGFQDYGQASTFDIAPSFLYKANDRLVIRLDAEVFTTKRPIILYAPWGGAGAGNFSELGLDIKQSFSGEGLDSRQTTTNLFARADYKISGNWTSQTNFSYTLGNNHTKYLFLNIEQYPDDSRYVSRENYDVNGTLSSTDFQQNFIGDFTIGNFRNRLLIGFDYLRYTYASTRIDAYFDTVDIHYSTPQPINIYNVNQVLAASPARRYAGNDQTYSAYISDVFNITDKLLAMASVRIDRYVEPGDDGLKQTALSPKFGLVYQLVKNKVSLFGNYMNGFQNSYGEDSKGNAFKPQQANQLEGGVKLDVFDHKLSATISYYNIKVQDVLRTDPNDPTFSIQDGTQRSQGIDVDIIANPLPGLNIVAGYAYNDNKYIQAEDYLIGKRNTGTPWNTGNIWVSYKAVRGALHGLGIGAGANFSGSTYALNDDNSFVLDGYKTFDATAFYDFTKWRLSVKLNNIGNLKYWVADYYPVPQAPRQFLASLTVRF